MCVRGRRHAGLAATADVFLTNLLPVRLEKFGLDPARLTAANPRLVYASVSGWGLQGEEKDKMAFDMTAMMARGGIQVHLPSHPVPNRPIPSHPIPSHIPSHPTSRPVPSSPVPNRDGVVFDYCFHCHYSTPQGALGLHSSGLKPRPGQGDHQTGAVTLSAILAALLQRHTTGRGGVVETSLIRTATWNLSLDLGLILILICGLLFLPRVLAIAPNHAE